MNQTTLSISTASRRRQKPAKRTASDMGLDLLQRCDVPAAIAVEQKRADPRGLRAGPAPPGRTADVPRLARLAAGLAERCGEDAWIGLAGSRRGRADDAVERRPQPAALQHLGQRDIPVGDA